MAGNAPPSVEEFAARFKPKRPALRDVLDRRPELWADVVRLRDPDGEFRLGWEPILEYLRLHGVETSPSSLADEWRRRR